MMDTAQRIAQFEAMVRPEADPNNDMAWFSLGQAYSQAARHADAARAFARCTEINPDMSKAYQLGGQALVAAGDNAAAGKFLTTGYEVAARRGDRMPMKAIGDVLTTLGIALPQVAEPGGAAGIGGDAGARGGAGGGSGAGEASGASLPPGTFVCAKTGRPGTKMVRPPFRGAVGEWIAGNIATETFSDWIKQGTKVINEMRLDLSRDQDSETYDQQMREYLGIDEAMLAQIQGTKKPE